MCVRTLLALCLAASLALTSSIAHAADWIVERSSGDVRIERHGGTPVFLSTFDAVRPGDRVATGANGRVMLVRGAQSIVVSPNSVLHIPAEQGGDGHTTLLQLWGNVTYDVDRRSMPHFEVQTEFLSAVVKGTQFTVDVDHRETSIAVNRGSVEVFDFDTGEFGVLEEGQAAKTIAARSAGLTLLGRGKLDTIKRRAPTPSLMERQGMTFVRASNAGRGVNDMGVRLQTAETGENEQPPIEGALAQDPSRSAAVVPASTGFGFGRNSGYAGGDTWNAARPMSKGEQIASLVLLCLSIVFVYDLVSNILRRRHRRWMRRQRDNSDI